MIQVPALPKPEKKQARLKKLIAQVPALPKPEKKQARLKKLIAQVPASQKPEERQTRLKKSISVFFPAYNDEASIEKMVLDALWVLKRVASDYEVIVVDDASPDRAGRIADNLAKKYSQVKVVHHRKNRGYGGALKSGFKAASKELIFYTDGDAQFDAKELEKFLPYIDNYDMVNGYKTKRSDNVVRVFFGNLYNFGSRLFFGIKIRDIDCDFRLFNRRVIDGISLESDSGLICVEMVKKITDKGFSIKEVPISHYHRLRGGSSFFKPAKILATLMAWAMLWWKLVLGKKLGLVKG